MSLNTVGNQVNRSPIKADDMRNIGNRNETSHALMLFFALNTSPSAEFYVPSIIHELEDRGIKVNNTDFYDAIDDLSDLGLGSVIRTKEGVDVFKRNYDLNKWAGRAFTTDELAEWKVKYNQDNSIKLIDTKYLTPIEIEEAKPKKSGYVHTGRRPGRPANWSLKFGRPFTEEEMRIREIEKASKKHYSKPGRPVGWRKAKVVSNQPSGLKASLGAFAIANAKRSRGRPPGAKNKSVMTAEKLKQHMQPVRVNRTPEAPVQQAAPQVLNGNMTSIPLGRNRYMQMQLPEGFNKKDLAMVHLILENMIENS